MVKANPDWDPYLLGSPDLLGGTHRPEPGTVTQIPPNFTNILMASYSKHNSDWLRLGNVLNNMYHIRKVVPRHKNAHCSLDTYETYVWKYGAARHAVDDNHIPGSHRNFPNNWPEIKGFHCPQGEEFLVSVIVLGSYLHRDSVWTIPPGRRYDSTTF